VDAFDAAFFILRGALIQFAIEMGQLALQLGVAGEA
jgi:hypothetical protein